LSTIFCLFNKIHLHKQRQSPPITLKKLLNLCSFVLEFKAYSIINSFSRKTIKFFVNLNPCLNMQI